MFVAHHSRMGSLLVAFAIGLVATPVAATNYDVGPGQALAAIANVPWKSLQPGDLVRIHYRPEPYREKWVIGRSGTAQAPMLRVPLADGVRDGAHRGHASVGSYSSWRHTSIHRSRT